MPCVIAEEIAEKKADGDYRGTLSNSIGAILRLVTTRCQANRGNKDLPKYYEIREDF